MTYNQKYYLENKDKIKARTALWRKNHIEQIRAREKKMYAENPELVKQKLKKWRLENPGRKLLADRKWKAKNPDRVLGSRNKRKVAMAAYIKVYERERRKIDPAYKIRKNLSVRLRQALKAVGERKTYSMSSFLGCSLSHFRSWLEFWMQPGMTWENYGYDGWHIDHKKPCASFDLTKIEEQKKCFHYTNLQPLWKLDNLRKGDKCSV